MFLPSIDFIILRLKCVDVLIMKTTKQLILLTLIVLTSSTTFAQQCNCSLAFKWAKNAFEENDAGFQYILDQKGNEAYQIHNNAFQKKVKKITNPDSCAFAIRQWAKFFRVGHFGFIVNPVQSAKNTSMLEKNSTTKKTTHNSFSQSSTYVQDYDSSTVYLRIKTFDSNHTKEIGQYNTRKPQQYTE